MGGYRDLEYCFWFDLAICERIEKEKLDVIVEVVTSYRDVFIFYNPLVISVKQIRVEIDRFLKESGPHPSTGHI